MSPVQMAALSPIQTYSSRAPRYPPEYYSLLRTLRAPALGTFDHKPKRNNEGHNVYIAVGIGPPRGLTIAIQHNESTLLAGSQYPPLKGLAVYRQYIHLLP